LLIEIISLSKKSHSPNLGSVNQQERKLINLNLEEYINLYYGGIETWFKEECNKYIHQDRIMNILNINGGI